jgi:hypothetical protein
MSLHPHAFVIEAVEDDGVETALLWTEKELGMKALGNPDVVVLRHGLLTVEDARKVFEVAASAPFAGENKVIIIAASRAYHEAQNALLKLFEEPPKNTYLFLVLPTLGSLLPTLRSRVQELKFQAQNLKSQSNPAEEFIKASKEKRSTMIKRIAAHQDGGAVSAREEAIVILNGVEMAAYKRLKKDDSVVALLSDIAVLRKHLYDRSAPVKMILEHLSIVIPKSLSADS